MTRAFLESYVARRGLCIVLRIRRTAAGGGEEGEETSALDESLADVSEPLTRAVVFSGWSDGPLETDGCSPGTTAASSDWSDGPLEAGGSSAESLGTTAGSSCSAGSSVFDLSFCGCA